MANVGFSRVMEYYNPKWAAFLSIIVSILCALAFPLFGYIFVELVFVIMQGKNAPNYTSERNKWCLLFLAQAFGMGILTFL